MSRSSAPPPKPRPAKMEAVALGAAFREAVALKRVTMPVVENRVTAVIGPSGCGKSTFIRCLNRMHEVVPGATRTGEVLLDGESIYGPEVDPVSVRRRVGMVFQKPNPFPDMSVRDNVLSGLRLNGIRPANADSVVDESHGEGGLLEYPQYTRPLEFRGARVPDVLAGGNHSKIRAFRDAERLERTRARRPDLLARRGGDPDAGGES